MFDTQAGAERASRFTAILHDKLRSVPPAIEVEETLPLAYIENLWFEQAKLYQAALGAPPATKNRAAEL